MGFELLHLCSAALLCILKAANTEGECTLPSFELRNVALSRYYSPSQIFPEGSELTFECLSGHKPVDSRATKSITCRRSQWTNLGLSCTMVKCAAPPGIENGHLLDKPLESYDYSQVVTYRCNSGFSLSGSSNLHCSDDGTFKPDPPKCLDGCPRPEIPHAIRTGGRSPPYKIGHFIEYKCEDLYTLKGVREITCTAEGWSPEPPKCIEPCSVPNFGRKVTLTKEFSSKSLFPHGSKVTFKCSSGYEPVDSTASNSVTCDETKWTKLHLTCKATKPEPPPVIENGKIEAVIYKCNSGFFLTGSSMLLFSEDGTFEQDPPKCLSKI